MLSLVVALTMSADLVRAPVGVASISRRPGVEKVAPKVVSRVAELLISEGVDQALDVTTTQQRLKKAGSGDSTACAGGQQCALKLATALGPHAVLVTVDVSKFGAELDIRLEALAADATAPIATADVNVDAGKWKELSSSNLGAFVKELKGKLVVVETPAQVVPPKKDEPVATVLEPKPKPQPLPPAAPKLRPVGFALVGVAGAAVVVTAVLLGLSAADHSRYQQSLIDPTSMMMTMRSSLPPEEGRRLLQGINDKLTGALITGLLAAVCGGVSIPFFLSPATPPAEPDVDAR